MKGELAQGKIEGKIVTCHKHGSKVDITTGKCLSGAKVLFMTMKTKGEPVYEVKVEGNSIKVGRVQIKLSRSAFRIILNGLNLN